MICFTLQLYLQLWFFKELSKENYFDIFWASSLITSYSFITATPSYTYKISGSGTSFPYSSWVVDSSLSQIHTIHSFIPTSLTAPIFLSLNLTDGSAISQLYNFSMPCSATYHMEMKDTSLYATGYWSSLLTIFVFDTTTSTFSFYRYQSSSLVPYYLVVDPNSDR